MKYERFHPVSLTITVYVSTVVFIKKASREREKIKLRLQLEQAWSDERSDREGKVKESRRLPQPNLP